MAVQDLRTVFTYAELKNRMAPDDELLSIVEALSAPLSMMGDTGFEPANNGDNHIVGRRLYEPQGSERYINQGGTVSVSQVEQVEEYSSIIEDWIEIDELIVNRSQNKKACLLQEETGHLEGLRKRFDQRIFHGDRSSNPLQINGLANSARDYSSYANDYVFDNAEGSTPSATANKTRIWFIKHGPTHFHCFTPASIDHVTGIHRDFKGLVTRTEDDAVLGANTRRRDVYRTKLQIGFGISIPDPRDVVCVVNISATNQTGDTDFDVNENVLTDAINYIEGMVGLDGVVCYMHLNTRARILRVANALCDRHFDEALGRLIYDILGIPIHCTNQISITESRITS